MPSAAPSCAARQRACHKAASWSRGAIEDAGVPFRLAAVRAVARDSTFTEDNDPYGDHTFGAVTVESRKVWWKIDLYDLDYRWGSEDAANTAVTRRVLTIMFPEDY